MEKYRLTLFPDTFLWTKADRGFIYNTKELKGFGFDMDHSLSGICESLLQPENLYSHELGNIKNERIRIWISSIERINAGCLHQAHENVEVSFVPYLKVQKTPDFYIEEHNKGMGSNIMHNLHELTFYLNTTVSGNNIFYRQGLFPLKNYPELMNIEKVLSFIKHSKNLFLSNINLTGNIFTYPDYMQLINAIADHKILCTIKITYHDFWNHIPDIKEKQWPENVSFHILINTDTTHPLQSIEDLPVDIAVTAYITSEDEYHQFEDKAKNLPLYCNAQIIPIYNGENIDFFNTHIFNGQEDLDNIQLTKREIFMRQALNTNNFGKLTIMPDGSVYANVNNPPLGTINDTVYSLVYKEITEGKSWLYIRDQEPCSDCVYQWLCPSPSNYEKVIGRPNLCHIKSGS